MMKMIETSRQLTWLSAIANAAKLQRIELPSFDAYGMGALRSTTTASSRFVTLKRRIVSADQAEVDGVEWALWRVQDDLPVPVAAFREPLQPKQENVTAVLSLLKGWLIDGWTPDEAKAVVSKHPRAQAVREPPPPSNEKAMGTKATD
jgi:hypothetical protein